MKIIVKRVMIDAERAISKVEVDGQLVCLGLEDPPRAVKTKGVTGIPAGVYKVGLRHSPKFSPSYGHNLLWVQNVPNFEYILIHKGNVVADTDGCLLVGNSLGVYKGEVAILNSKTAYDKLYQMVAGAAKAGQLEIEYINL